MNRRIVHITISVLSLMQPLVGSSSMDIAIAESLHPRSGRLSLDENFPWISRGRLYRLTHGPGRFVPQRLRLYVDAEGRYSMSTGSVEIVNRILSENVLKNDTANEVLQETFQKFLFSMFSEDGELIADQHAISTFRYLLGFGRDESEWTLERRERCESVINRISEYASDTKVTFDSHEWQATVFAISKNGSVRKLSFSGTVFPLRIAVASQQLVEPEGSLGRFLTTGTQ